MFFQFDKLKFFYAFLNGIFCASAAALLVLVGHLDINVAAFTAPLLIYDFFFVCLFSEQRNKSKCFSKILWMDIFSLQYFGKVIQSLTESFYSTSFATIVLKIDFQNDVLKGINKSSTKKGKGICFLLTLHRGCRVT